MEAEVYENLQMLTFYAANPKLVKDPKPIAELTYREMRELAYVDFFYKKKP